MKLLKDFLNHSLINIKIIWRNQGMVVSLCLIMLTCIYYKCHKINQNRDGSCIDPPDWIKNKKATITPINKKR